MTALILTAWVASSIGFAVGAWWATRPRDDGAEPFQEHEDWGVL
jgi:hypothetical protein